MLNNKYSKIYFSIIERAKSRTEPSVYELHHILPRSLGGSEEIENKVKLTPKEHFLCHLLLIKMTSGKDKIKMANAIWLMKNRCSTSGINSRIYESIRQITSNEQSKRSLKMWSDTETRSKLIAKRTGRRNTPETIEKMRVAAVKRHVVSPVSHESRKAGAEKLKGRKLPQCTREKISKSQLGVPKRKATCHVCGKTGGKNLMKRYHLDKCRGGIDGQDKSKGLLNHDC